MPRTVSFPLGPFQRHRRNPILLPQGNAWEAKDLFNPTAIVKGNNVYLLYRAEDNSGPGQWNGTSRIGLAVSTDGICFVRKAEPVIGPTERYETPGGCEDPRITCLDGMYYLTYTAYDGKTARLCLATSTDLLSWEKHGVLFPGWDKGPRYEWSKSGAIVPGKINGRYVMYFGDTDIWAAFSDDGIRWHPHETPVMRRRTDPEAFDSLLIEPGPSPIVTDDGILLIYNAARTILDGPHRGKAYYSLGQVLFSLEDPTKIVKRTETPFFEPCTEDETSGQIDFVVFAEGLVHFRNTWYLYYGMADSRIGVATLPAS